ncbi:hypothetical protein CBR_g38673 [Chara braunii]|uniref:CBS domain-containing protein n=1 Tax=Chara braunii TaxID=69332 RepID=A0A388K0P8_CHABU|nr:hypothetical protein CBR_g38673 [Chara braunii]|eukprot:GBG63607.1 hypothetical protein CBR_g38673 [Chara braunii]
MGPLSKGVHRLLVPFQEVQETSESVDGKGAERPFGGGSGDRGGETSENAASTSSLPKDVQACSAFRIFTQTDMMRFLVRHIDVLGPIVSCSIDDLDLLHPSLSVLAVPASMTVKDALRMMRSHGGVNAVAVVDPADSGEHEVGPPGWSRGGKLVGTLSASDFRGLDPKAIQEMHVMPVMEFVSRTCGSGVPLPLVSCRPTTPLATVMAEALIAEVHRVWVTDEESRLLGVVTFTDMIRAIKKELLGD